MCGFGVYRKGNDFNSTYISRRGQDHHNKVEINGFVFEHFLLSVTGEKTIQPFIDDDIVCLYNGEIYNHSFIKSDGENIIPLYKEHGLLFPKFLDGEFAIALFDFKKDVAVFVADYFASKPIYRNGINASSYFSGVGGEKVEARTINVVRISDEKLLTKIQYHNFDFNQYKNSYDDCLDAFTLAIKKRSKHRCFIGLSSGYDSGAIACELKKQNVDFKCYAIVASEDKYTLWMRDKYLNNVHTIVDFDHNLESKHLNDNAEEFYYDYMYGDNHMNKTYKNDWASRGLSYICKLGASEGRKVYLSGMGADEILSDYSLIPQQSTFKGVFPDRLDEWTNFYNGCMYSYLGKEECVAGSWNIETRYPFLDKQFVQEFLWLTPEIKNRKYKSPLYEYLTRNSFPFQENKKIGFCV